MGFKDITIGIIITAVFTLCLVSFGSLLAINNNALNNILNDPSISGINESLNSYLGGIQDSAQTQRQVFEQQEAQGGASSDGFSLTAIVGIVKTFMATAVASFNIIFTLLADVLNIPPLISNVILGGLILIILILIWRVIKSGGT